MDPEVIPAYRALEMATINGARALGLEEAGALKAGLIADLILLISETAPCPRHDVAAHLVYSASGADVDTVIVTERF